MPIATPYTPQRNTRRFPRPRWDPCGECPPDAGPVVFMVAGDSGMLSPKPCSSHVSPPAQPSFLSPTSNVNCFQKPPSAKGADQGRFFLRRPRISTWVALPSDNGREWLPGCFLTSRLVFSLHSHPNMRGDDPTFEESEMSNVLQVEQTRPRRSRMAACFRFPWTSPAFPSSGGEPGY